MFQFYFTTSFVGSHSRRGNCFDNACIESFFSHLKTKKLYLVRPKTYEMAYRAIQEYIQFYNTERFQEKPHVLSPIGRQCEKDRVYTWMFELTHEFGT